MIKYALLMNISINNYDLVKNHILNLFDSLQGLYNGKKLHLILKMNARILGLPSCRDKIDIYSEEISKNIIEYDKKAIISVRKCIENMIYVEW